MNFQSPVKHAVPATAGHLSAPGTPDLSGSIRRGWLGGRVNAPFQQAAFSLIEIIVVVGLMSFIILGLVMMFSQTQRAYKLGTTQVDVLEGGRAVMDLIQRELLQVAPANQPANSGATNFATAMLPAPYYPLIQELPGNEPDRTNVLQDLFFLSRENQKWSGIGYVVRTSQPGSGFTSIPTSGMGTLYRFETNHPAAFFGRYPNSFGVDFLAAIQNETNLNKVIEGVVHFTIRTFDAAGRGINTGHTNLFNNFNDHIFFKDAQYGETAWSFQSNAVPATVEIELGVLEDAALAKAKAITDLARRYDYLTGQVSRVHLFRIRVPIRNVDVAAYQ